MKKLLYTMLIAAIVIASCSESKEKRELSLANFENDAEYISIKKEYILNSDKTIDIKYSHRLKYNSYHAVNNLYGETFIPYNPMFQKLTINKCQTTMLDGTIVTAPDNAFNEILPEFAAHVPPYNHLREMVVTHTGLERGCIVDLQYTLSSSDEYLPFLESRLDVGATSPVKSYEIVVCIPDSANLKYRLINSESQALVKSSDGKKMYTWKFTDIASESHDALAKNNRPELIFSTAENFDNIRSFISDQPSFNKRINSDMKDFAEAFQNKNSTSFEVARKMQKSLVNNMNLYNISFELAGYRSRTPVDIWESNGGTEIEKNLLFSSLLNSIGIRNHLVFVSPQGNFTDSVGTFGQLGNIYVMLEDNLSNESDAYLSAIFMNEPFKINYLKLDVISMEPGGSKISMVSGGNSIAAVGKFKINKEIKLAGDISLELFLACNQYIDDQKNSLNKSYFNLKTSNDYQKTEKGYSRIICKIDESEALPSKMNYLFLEIPYVLNGVNSWGLSDLPSARSEMLEIPYKLKETYRYSIVLTPDISPVQLLLKEKKNSCGKVFFKSYVSGDTLFVRKELNLDRQKVADSVYSDFRDLMILWNDPKTNEIMLRHNE